MFSEVDTSAGPEINPDEFFKTEERDVNPNTLNGSLKQRYIEVQNTLKEIQVILAIVAAAAGAAPIVLVVKAKTLKPDKMKPYKRLSESEHMRWFREIDVKMMISPEYFTTPTAKILYCMNSLKGELLINWWQHTANAFKVLRSCKQVLVYQADSVGH